MRRILLIFKNDVKRRVKSPYAVLVLLLIPVAMTAIFGAIFAPSQGESKLPKIKVLLVDKDKNIGSKILLGSFDSPRLKEMFQVTIVGEAEGKKLISRGKASAMIVIPENFSDRLIKAKKSEFLVIKNPSEQFLPNVVEEFMVTYSVIISGLVQVFETEIKAIDALTDIPTEQISITAMTPFLERGKEKIVMLEKFLSPLLIRLKEEITDKKEEEEKGPVFNIFSVILPAISVMFLLFIIEIFIRDILTEREDGKFQRMMFSPVRSMEYIFARIISGWVMGIAVCLVIVLVGILLFNIHWGNYLYLFIFVTVTNCWIAAFFALLNSFFKNRRQSGAFTAPIILVFSIFGGSIVQVDQLSGAFRLISYITPNRWFIKGVELISTGTFPTLHFTVLLLTGILLFLLAAVFLKKRIVV